MTKTKKAYIPTKLELEGLLSITKEDSIQRWAMLNFSYFAGLRSMEIASLSIEDIFQGNELKGMAQLPTKGGGTRRITLVDKKLRSAISTFYEVQNLSAKPMTAPLFTNPSGGRYFATKLGNTPGITTRQMMALGGWSEPNVAMQYIETNEEQLDDLVGRASL